MSAQRPSVVFQTDTQNMWQASWQEKCMYVVVTVEMMLMATTEFITSVILPGQAILDHGTLLHQCWATPPMLPMLFMMTTCMSLVDTKNLLVDSEQGFKYCSLQQIPGLGAQNMILLLNLELTNVLLQLET